MLKFYDNIDTDGHIYWLEDNVLMCRPMTRQGGLITSNDDDVVEVAFNDIEEEAQLKCYRIKDILLTS